MNFGVLLLMPIKIRCVCGNVLLAPEDRVGQTGKCPTCNRAITVESPYSKNTDSKTGKTANAKLVKGDNLKFRAKKKSLVNKFFSLLIYLIFFILIFSLFSLHYFSEQEITKFSFKNKKLQEIWTENQSFILLIKEAHSSFFYSIIGKEKKKK